MKTPQSELKIFISLLAGLLRCAKCCGHRIAVRYQLQPATTALGAWVPGAARLAAPYRRGVDDVD